MTARRGHRTALGVAVAGAALVASAAVAAAAPAPPPGSVTVSPPGLSNAAARTFSWSAVGPDTPGNVVTYQGAVTSSAPPPGAGTSSGTATSISLSTPEGQGWFHVRAIESGTLTPPSGWTTIGPFTSDRIAPSITATQSPAANPRGWVTASVTVTFACTDASTVTCPLPVTFGEGAGQVATGTATDAAGNSATASRTVNVDLTDPVPGGPATPAEGAVVTSTRPEFSWTAATDPLSGLQYYEVWVVGRGKVASTMPRDTRVVSFQELPPGQVRWYVRTVDNANNDAVSAQSSFTLDPDRAQQAPDPPPGQAPGGVVGGGAGGGSTAAPPVVRDPVGGKLPRPAVLNAGALRPVAGRTVRSLRPTLRWKRRHGQATLYNVQVFELSRTGIRKVVSGFPKGTSYRIPKGKIRSEHRYVWRVWPYLGRKGYAVKPVGVSYFDVRAPRAGRSRVTLTARQLRINQRISQAAVRRVNEVMARLDGRPASPRGTASTRRARVTLSAGQLRINQRISQAAVRRVNAARARLDGRPAPRRAATATSRGRVTLSVRQLRINQRIAQASVRRVKPIRVQMGLDKP